MGWVWDQRIEPPTKKMVLLAIADHAGHDGDNAWPSVARIAGMVGINSRNTQRYIRQLEAEGYLIVGKQQGGNLNTPEDRRPNLYRVVVRGGAGDTPKEERGGAGDTPRGGAGDTLTVQRTIQITGAKAPRGRDALFDALVEVCRIDTASLTTSARGAANKALKELREVNATAEQVHQAAKAYRAKYPTAGVTPSALAKHWPQLVEPERVATTSSADYRRCPTCDGTGWATPDHAAGVTSVARCTECEGAGVVVAPSSTVG